MPVIRAFIAIELPRAVHNQLEKINRDLQSRIQPKVIRWVPVSNIHLTIKFLGDISISGLNLLTEILAREAARHSSFEINVSGLGAFPNLRRPRVVWVGMQAPTELSALQKGIDTVMNGLGYLPEDRPFSPHLTLARVSNNTAQDDVMQIGNTLAAYPVGNLGMFTASSIHLFRSDLQPSGAVYTKIFSASFFR